MSEFVDQEAAGRSPKSTNGATIHSAIQNAAKKVRSTVDVSAHKRGGTKGVKAYTSKRTPAQKRTEVLKNMLELSSHDSQLATVKEKPKITPQQAIAKELKGNKTPWAKEHNRKQKIHNKIDAHTKEQKDSINAYHFANARLNKLIDEGRAKKPDAEFVIAHRRVNELDKLTKTKQRRIEKLFYSLDNKPEGVES